jgi:NitT/TauT family transport system substrate-binding protein
MAAGFLERRGVKAEYGILRKGQRSAELLREGAVDIMQSAVSSNWKPMEQGESALPVHFAQINRRDGFFLVGREADGAFEWAKLAGKAVLADHGAQPLAMLKYAARTTGLEWGRVEAIDAGAPEAMAQAFREGRGEYVHLQSPAAHELACEGAGHVVVSVGAAMPPVAFSSLCSTREFAGTETFRAFLAAFGEARAWVQTAPAEEVARAEAGFFEGHTAEALTAGIRAYQELGTWEGGTEIPRELYEQALEVFRVEGGIGRRHPYEAVCLAGL